MTRRDADFDEFCDPDKPRQIKIEDVLAASDRLRSHIMYTPCVPSHAQKDFVLKLYYKLETLQKTGSFKERGVLNALQLIRPEKHQQGVVLASLGNAAISMCHHGAKLGIPVVVVMPHTVPITMLQKCHSLGAKVIVQGKNLMDAQRHARSIARARGATYINGRDHPNVLAGYGTIGLEILEQVPLVNAVIVPVGCGGLAAAVANVIKHIKPKCLVYGVQTENMPAFFKSLENGAPTIIPMQSTIANEIAVPHVGVNSFTNGQSYLDKMLLVNDDWIARAVLHLLEQERLVVEPSGASSLATVIGQLVPELRSKNVVCLLSGGNIDVTLLSRTIHRGMAAEGRLMKFRVNIPDSSGAQAKLFKLLESEGYNVVTQFQEHRWFDDDIYTLEEDFDANCDPHNPKELQLKDVLLAEENLRPTLIKTPCVPSHYQKEFVMRLYYKLEILQKSGSFKERGVLNVLELLPRDKQKIGVVVASLGNAALAMCICALKLRIPVKVVLPTCVPTSKLQKCYSLGAQVIVHGGNLLEAQRYARAIAKDEGLTYINGFKERGVLNVLELLPRDKQKIGVVVASLGNAALAMCICALKLRIPVKVVLPTCVPTSKLQKCYSLGAQVIVHGGNLLEAQRYARAIAKDEGLTYINGRDHPHLLAGYGTLSLEILEQVPLVDAVIVPVGCGGLIASVATVIKNLKPSCLVYGVEPEGMPVFAKSIENGEMTSVEMQPSIADAVAVTHVGVNSYTSAKLIDKMLCVNDNSVGRAMLHLVEKERYVVEGAGAYPLAAIMSNLAPELMLKNVVCILTGGNVDPVLFPRCLERGLSAEGRLIKVKVRISDSSAAQTELLKLIADGGYSLVRQCQEHRWVEEDAYKVQMHLVCRARNIYHGLELKKILERAYPGATVFETEPFNDKRTCPCIIRKFLLLP